MAQRSALRRLVSRAYREINGSPSLTGHIRVPPGVGVAQGAYCVDFQGHDGSEGSWRKDWNEENTSTSHVANRAGFSHKITGKSPDSDSREEPENGWAATSAVEHPPEYRWNWDRTINFIGMRNAKDALRELSGNGSAQISAESGSCVRFMGHRLGHVASLTGCAGVSPRVWKGGSIYSSRSFSSVPDVSEDGAQATSSVDGELLDSLQVGLSGVSEAESVISSLPSSGSKLSEVAAAAADCSYPTAFIQYVIDSVHVSTGLPWWLSIAATTVAIRVLVLPLMVYQMKSTARLTLLRPELEKLTNRIKESNYAPNVVEENQIHMKALFLKHKTTPFSPILGAFIQAPIFMCFFFAIRNMAEKMESFKEGGALWFTDLTTPDSLFILPVLSGAFFLLTIELGATDGMQGQPMMAKMKMFLRGLAVLLVPLTASFPKALFCYWLTANVCSLVQASVFKQPGVKAALGIPDVSHLAKPLDIPISPVVTFSQHPRSKGETPAVTFSQHPRSKGASSKRQR